MTWSPAAQPPSVEAVEAVEAAAASKCPPSPAGVKGRAVGAADGNSNSPPAEAENSSWLVNTPERRPSYYGGVPYDVARSAITASRGGVGRGGGIVSISSSSRHCGGNIDGAAMATATAAASASTSGAKSLGGAGCSRPKWEDSEPAPLSSLKQLLDGLEERRAEAGLGDGESRSVFGCGTAVSGRRASSWSLSSSSSPSRRRRRKSSGGSSGGGIVRIGSTDSSSTFLNQAVANSSGGGDAGDVGLVSSNKRNFAKRTRGDGGDLAGAAAASLSSAGLMSPPSPAVTKSVLAKKKSKRT